MRHITVQNRLSRIIYPSKQSEVELEMEQRKSQQITGTYSHLTTSENQQADVRYKLEQRQTRWRKLMSGLLILGHVLESEDGLLTAGGNHSKVHSAIVLLKSSTDLLSELSLGKTNVILGVAVLRVHKGAESITVDVHEHVLLSLDDGDVHVVGGRADILELLASEDVESDKVNFGVTVLSGL
ncbi:hypothetical protein PMAYCL1PPCAC_06577 [Pristionchus mayeri]|uniref:Uncharacterized protein n=1 Tax=Pristionchus mayeri TaxID=1317129 RepID=A0AAN4Z8D7_9BILA|nr:hypothetical protein PMAYCL1PPCAC_06577 [Pristionchus mayeri]